MTMTRGGFARFHMADLLLRKGIAGPLPTTSGVKSPDRACTTHEKPTASLGSRTGPAGGSVAARLWQSVRAGAHRMGAAGARGRVRRVRSGLALARRLDESERAPDRRAGGRTGGCSARTLRRSAAFARAARPLL